MNLQKVVYASLVGSLIVIGSLVGAWAKDMTNRVSVHDGAILVLSQSASKHDQELVDIHQDLLRIERLLEQEQHQHAR